jgi:glycosyltransferase involved in cell wall biosynthesis
MNALIFKFPYSSLYGGGEAHTLKLAERLSQRGWSFFLVSSCRVLLEEFSKRHWPATALVLPKEPVTIPAILLFTIFAPIIFLQLSAILFYYRLTKNVRVLYCLSLTEKILVTPVARLLGMKVYWMEHLLMERWIQMNPYRFSYVLCAGWARIVTVSEAVKKTIVALGVRADRVVVIPAGVDINHFTPMRRQGSQQTIGYIGRFSKEKGLDVLLAAFHQLRKTHPHVRMLWVGKGPLEQELRAEAIRLGIDQSLTIYPHTSDIREFVRECDVMIMPATRRDSFGMLIIEAGAMNIPTIATSIGGFPEVIQQGKTGWIVPPGDPEALANQCAWVLDHGLETREIGKAARRWIAYAFPEQKMIDRFDALFRYDRLPF